MYQDDEIRSQLDDIYSGKVGAPPSADLLKRVDEEGPKRYRSQIPPGYKDDAKDGEVYAYGGRTIEKRYGDLLIWFQIIEEAQLKSIKDIILVTDDEKEDWWWIVASLGKKTIGPRPELIEEIISQAGVGSFYMYNSERFLRFAAEQLGVKIERESVEQVGDVARSYSRDLPSNMEARVRGALKVWLSAQFETVIEVGGFPDFVAIDHATGLHHGFEIRKTDESLGELRTALKALNKQRAKVPLDDLTFVVVADNQQEAEMSRRLFARRIVHALPPDVRLVVGIIFGDPQTFVQVGDALG